MQGFVKDIFDLDRCWIQCNGGNRWLIAAMGANSQMHQLKALHEKKLTWKIKD